MLPMQEKKIDNKGSSIYFTLQNEVWQMNRRMLMQFLMNIVNDMKKFWSILVSSMPAVIETGYFSQVSTLYM